MLERQLQHSSGIEAPPMEKVLVLPTAAVLVLLELEAAVMEPVLEPVLEQVLEPVAAGAGSYLR